MAPMRVWAAVAALFGMFLPGQASALYEGLQCVPYARQVSGIQIRGDAWTWWEQAEGRYARGSRPRVGAVLSFRPFGGMRLGHVAAVSRVVDNRTILVRHANWSLIDGMRGHVEDDVEVRDVSEANDWSEVRVWFAPLGDLGTTHWPVNGFIYPERVDGGAVGGRMVIASAERTQAPDPNFGRSFLASVSKAAADEQRPAMRAPAPRWARAASPRLSYAALSANDEVAAPQRARSGSVRLAMGN